MEQPKDLRKLSVEEHAQIAMHLHAADHHLMKVVNLMFESPWALVPMEIVDAIEDIRDRIGAATSPSRHSQGDIADRCHDVLSKDWPGSTKEVYYGTYADCSTLAMDSPDKPAGFQP